MRFIYLYTPQFLKTIIYMLQTSGYDTKQYANWVLNTKDFRTVRKRQKLVMTAKASLLLSLVTVLAVTLIVVGFIVFVINVETNLINSLIGILIILCYPLVVTWLIVLPLFVGEILVQRPREKKIITRATQTLSKHSGQRIAIAGSFGKTSFKEMLSTILVSKLHIAASPGNMNTPIGLSRFIDKLDTTEDVLIFEIGEEKIGDVKNIAEFTRPTSGVITGISEAHLTSFGSLENAINTIFELQDYLGDKKLYANGENEHIVKRLGNKYDYLYSSKGFNGWKVSGIKVDLSGTEFTVKKHDKSIHAKSKLIGHHQIGPLLACIDMADSLGLSPQEITDGVAETKPFEHRMAPYQLGGATIIDDTYNGNIKGVMAGVDLLKTVDAKRKIYVTPGLVEQGDKVAEIHVSIGEIIAPVFNQVVLMKNSTTEHILHGLEQANFTGETILISDPLDFYTNLQHFTVAGDVVLMQNDWTDNYA